MKAHKHSIMFLIVMCLTIYPLFSLSQDIKATPTAQEEIEEGNENAETVEEPSSEDTVEVEKLNVNFASIEDLQELTGGNKDLAQALAEGRPYAKLDDILAVDGMSADLFAEMHDLIEIRKLNLNDATLAELMLLPGIDERIARAIIEHRPYKIVEQLLRIRGISEQRLQEFRDQVEVIPARQRAENRGWNIKRRNAPLKLERPLEKRESEDSNDSVNVEPTTDENGGQ